MSQIFRKIKKMPEENYVRPQKRRVGWDTGAQLIHVYTWLLSFLKPPLQQCVYYNNLVDIQICTFGHRYDLCTRYHLIIDNKSERKIGYFPNSYAWSQYWYKFTTHLSQLNRYIDSNLLGYQAYFLVIKPIWFSGQYINSSIPYV